MGLFDKLRGELIDIIEWLDDSRDTIVWRFPRYQNEIKMGAKLVVRETQNALFVNEGRLADIFTPGTYTLETRNLPILTTLMGWKYGFDSPFKAEVYFVNMRQFVDLKWGTANPVMLRDAEFGPIRLRAYGTYSIRVTDPKRFLEEIVGTDQSMQTDEISDQLRNMIISRFTDLLAESKIAALDLAASYDELARFASERLQKEFGEYGLDLSKFLVENISFPPEVEKALDRRTEINVVGDLGRYTQLQAANAMEAAARNPAGGGGEGLGMGMGLAMGAKMAETLAGGGAAPRASGGAPPPPPPSAPAAAAASYYLGIAGRQVGPLDLNGLRGEVRAGRLSGATLVWREGMAAWAPADQVPEVAALLRSAGPPPLPQ
jgi:membrane protease subunit (stomatin/prohibitin family)